ncbi:unnamed protein product, partial [Aphanomyces euteiches]
MPKKQSNAAPSAIGEQTSLGESLNPPALDGSEETTPLREPSTDTPPDALATLKAMIEAQYEEIKLLKIQTLDASKPSVQRSTELEAKDLLRKVRFNFSSFKIKFQNICQLRHIWDVIQGTETVPDTANESQILEFEDK